MAKLAPISGFPEWLPEQKLVEDTIIKKIRTIYEQHGFVPIETPAVEMLDTLTAKGVVDRELYVVRRLHADESETTDLGLHFDVTVPFAHYTAQHMAKLVFPFKRYQLQKVWRGERPQKGRYREFYQFDIDIVAREILPLSCDAEVLTAYDKVISLLGIYVGPHTIRVNSRKILSGYYQSLGLDENSAGKVVQIVDKILKIGPDGVNKELSEALSLSEDVSNKILAFANVTLPLQELDRFAETYRGVSPLLDEGINDLQQIRSLLPQSALPRFFLDGSLARGLAYYTGLIFETALERFPKYGSICSGGRYDNLCSQFTSQKLPGVGGSIGLSRVMGLLFEEQLIEVTKKTTTEVLISVYSEEQRVACNTLAEDLRGRGFNVDVYFTSAKLGKQIEYADNLKIPWIIFIKEDGTFEVKSMQDKSQVSCKTVTEILESISVKKA